MSPFSRHVLLPATGTLAVVGLYLTPVTVIPCVTRGLLAFAVVLASLLAGIGLGVRGVVARAKGRPVSPWWIVTMAVLAVPAILVLGPLG